MEQHRELFSVLCTDVHLKKMDICIWITDSLCNAEETDTILYTTILQ